MLAPARAIVLVVGLAAVLVGSRAAPARPQPLPFSVDEATIATIQAALASRTITCAQLVRAYLARIEAYDRKGPALSAIININPRALPLAESMDRAGTGKGPRPPLHCVPLVLKDNFDTADMPTTGGARTLAQSVPPDDAFVVNRFREAGAIILAKANLTELALTGTTVSSLGGQTRNPYDLTRTPGGSSGGTGAAVAANLAAAGTGSDTGQSIRSPASANALVGLRPTRGLISRDGIMPFSATQDEIGPMTRTVQDAARMLDVMAGYDPADPITAFSSGRLPVTYTSSLDANGLKGARVGRLGSFSGRDAVHDPVNRVMARAVDQMKAMGATVLDVEIPNLDALTRGLSLMAFEFQPTFNRYLASLGASAPVKTFSDFMRRGEFHPSLQKTLETYLAVADGPDRPEYLQQLRRRAELRQAVMTVIAAHKLDAILYPHQRRLVVPIGEEQVERNGILSNSTGFPALTFPGGFSEPTTTAPLGVPVGIELLGPEWSEPALLKLAYAYEQAARVRKPPISAPDLR
jgi:Asp-tRNA(Asn)/Glu-tRNA(Gln) amidotransferase A subunit family amidase